MIEEKALNYPHGVYLRNYFRDLKVPISLIKGSRIGLKGDTLEEKYQVGKDTLIVGVKSITKFQSCKPSAHYQLPLVSGCMGMCEYCYLNTQMGKRPYIKIHVNVGDILNKADDYARERLPEITIFEGAATSDPLPVEPYSQALEEAIVHFGKSDHSRFRFVSKYTDVDSLLHLPHNGRTEIRFSINIDTIIKQFEHRTPPFEKRLEAARKVAKAGYPVGVIIAPVFWQEPWKKEYDDLLRKLANELGDYGPTVEVISHRYTTAAKNNIMEIFPQTELPMEDEERSYKYGQFGYGKFVYPKEELQEMKAYFQDKLTQFLPPEKILYII